LSFRSTSLKMLALDSIIYSHYNQTFIQRKNVTVNRRYMAKDRMLNNYKETVNCSSVTNLLYAFSQDNAEI